MSDLHEDHDQRVIKKPRRSKRPARSTCGAEAVPLTPARRTRSSEAAEVTSTTVHPRREDSVFNATKKTRRRSPSPPCGERDPDPAPPPPTRRTRRAAESLVVTPCKRADAEAEAPVPAAPSPPSPPWHSGPLTTRKVLRSREIIFPYSPPPPRHCEPTPRRNQKGKEGKHDRRSWQTPKWAVLGLEHYNNMNQGDEHEMVKVGVSSSKFIFGTFWMHANFMAKRKGATSCVDLVPKFFFAELKMEGGEYSCVSCVKLNPAGDVGVCGLCPQEIMHPACGGYVAAPSRPAKQRAVGCLQISFSF